MPSPIVSVSVAGTSTRPSPRLPVSAFLWRNSPAVPSAPSRETCIAKVAPRRGGTVDRLGAASRGVRAIRTGRGGSVEPLPLHRDMARSFGDTIHDRPLDASQAAGAVGQPVIVIEPVSR